jgi:hypothetical protein
MDIDKKISDRSTGVYEKTLDSTRPIDVNKNLFDKMGLFISTYGIDFIKEIFINIYGSGAVKGLFISTYGIDLIKEIFINIYGSGAVKGFFIITYGIVFIIEIFIFNFRYQDMVQEFCILTRNSPLPMPSIF